MGEVIDITRMLVERRCTGLSIVPKKKPTWVFLQQSQTYGYVLDEADGQMHVLLLQPGFRTGLVPEGSVIETLTEEHLRQGITALFWEERSKIALTCSYLDGADRWTEGGIIIGQVYRPYYNHEGATGVSIRPSDDAGILHRFLTEIKITGTCTKKNRRWL